MTITSSTQPQSNTEFANMEAKTEDRNLLNQYQDRAPQTIGEEDRETSNVAPQVREGEAKDASGYLQPEHPQLVPKRAQDNFTGITAPERVPGSEGTSDDKWKQNAQPATGFLGSGNTSGTTPGSVSAAATGNIASSAGTIGAPEVAPSGGHAASTGFSVDSIKAQATQLGEDMKTKGREAGTLVENAFGGFGAKAKEAFNKASSLDSQQSADAQRSKATVEGNVKAEGIERDRQEEAQGRSSHPISGTAAPQPKGAAETLKTIGAAVGERKEQAKHFGAMLGL